MLQKKKIKSLDVTELRKIFNSILSNYDTCTEKTKLVVNSIAISMNEITQTDGQQCGIFRHMETDDVDKDYASNQIVELINKHKNSFLPSRGAFKSPDNYSTRATGKILEGWECQLRKQKRMRITSNREKRYKRNINKPIECVETPEICHKGKTASYFINRKSLTSCGFCGSNETGENISNCQKRMQYQRKYCEFIVSKTDKGYVHLMNRLQNNIPVPMKEYPDHTVSTVARSHRGKHIVIFNIWMNRQSQTQARPRLMSDMLFEIGYIDKQGEIEPCTRTIRGEEFESMISAMKFRSKKTFIYDRTVTEGDVFQHTTSFSQNSTHSFVGNNLQFRNFNQIQYGRLGDVNNPPMNFVNNTNDHCVDDNTYFSL